MRYFSGTASHNTVMLGDNDQMLKGGRFIWYYWSQSVDAAMSDDDDAYVFTGVIKAFSYIKDGIVHRRRVKKLKGQPVWEIHDEVIGASRGMEVRQLWHMPLSAVGRISITAKDSKGASLAPHKGDGWYSSLYGQKEKTEECYFSAFNEPIKTLIKVAAST